MNKVRVKICGITRPEDAIIASEAGADAIGLNFYHSSPRFIDINAARQIVDLIPPFITKVGLFVDDTPEYIHSVINNVNLNLLQFHGDEDQNECIRYKLPYIKAIRMTDAVNFADMVSRYDKSSAILTDTYVAGVPGGTGKTFNWELVDQTISKPLILAGGLTPENVGEAISSVKPYAVDVSGGVEESPGIKDRNKMIQFIQNAKGLRDE